MFEFSLNQDENNPTLDELTSHIDTSQFLTYIINFPANFSHSKMIRDFVGAIFDTFEINHPWKGRFILITDELVNNSIEHGSESIDINKCKIAAGRGEDGHFHIMLEVHDTGKKQKSRLGYKEFEDIKNERLNQDEKNKVYMEKRGRGLFHITEKIVDRLSFSDSPIGGLAVKIEKCIETPDGKSCEIEKTPH